jgi:hypothetical protein
VDVDIVEEEIEMTHLVSSDNKLTWWGNGEWVEEPDSAVFNYKNYQCKCVRIMALEGIGEYFGGHWCGYICIPKDHAWYGKERDGIDCNIHGGITYSEEEEDGFWIGFDCAHAYDMSPSINMIMQKRNIPGEKVIISFLNPTYKNLNYVIQECKKLVDQAIEASKE